MRRWTIKLPQSAPYECTVSAFDWQEALALGSTALGISIEPCCELGDEPCHACALEARIDEDDRAYDRERDRRMLEQEETP